MTNSQKEASLKEAAKEIFKNVPEKERPFFAAYLKSIAPKLVASKITETSIEAIGQFKEGEPLYTLLHFNTKMNLLNDEDMLSQSDFYWVQEINLLLIKICTEKYIIDEVEEKMFDEGGK